MIIVEDTRNIPEANKHNCFNRMLPKRATAYSKTFFLDWVARMAMRLTKEKTVNYMSLGLSPMGTQLCTKKSGEVL
jgi:hypothetical protein